VTLLTEPVSTKSNWQFLRGGFHTADAGTRFELPRVVRLLALLNCLTNQKGGPVMKTSVNQNGNLFPSMPSLLEDFLLRDLLDPSSGRNWKSNGATLPAVNVGETNDAFIIEMAAPGMKRDDFHVELDNNTLTISSKYDEKNENKNNQNRYTRREFSYESFQRSFSLPENKVEGDKIAAKYTDGILYITVPKRDEAKIKPPKQISIS
jgi:HSP20 family protein